MIITDHIQIKDLPYCKTVRKWLFDRYGQEADQIWTETVNNYNGYLEDLPDYGGKKNGHAKAIYGGLLIFALYPAFEERLQNRSRNLLFRIDRFQEIVTGSQGLP